MKLSHLLLTIFLTCLLTALLIWLEGLAGVSLPQEERLWISIVPATVGAIVMAWPFARLLGMRPLMILCGSCPGCKKRPPGWWNSGTDTDLLQLSCGDCGERVNLWLTSPRPANLVSSDVPTYILRWPRFLGVWRRIDAGNG